MDKKNNEEYPTMKVDPNFEKRMIKFKKEWEDKNGIPISMPKITKILDNKIEKQGGLVV